LKLVLGTFKVDFSKDTIDPMVEGMLKMMGVFAELERNMISERVKSGIKNAKAKGTVVGRPPVRVDDIPDLFIRGYNLYKEGKIRKSELARLVRMSRTTVDKYINMLE
jgi:DNA invertase Pin-like site-specific DNA recombinase